MKKEKAKECKYCGLAIEYGEVCACCSNKRPLVQELIEAGEPFRKLKARRDARRKANGL